MISFLRLNNRHYLMLNFPLFFLHRPLLSGGRQATRKWQSMRTSNSCCRLLWTTLRRSYRRASPCHGTSTQSTEAHRLASSSQKSTPHRPTTTSTPGDRYVIISNNLLSCIYYVLKWTEWRISLRKAKWKQTMVLKNGMTIDSIRLWILCAS